MRQQLNTRDIAFTAVARDVALLASRIGLGVLMIWHAKLTYEFGGSIAGVIGMFEQTGIPLPVISAPANLFGELLGGAALIACVRADRSRNCALSQAAAKVVSMSTTTRSVELPRTAEAVREVLAEHRPDLHELFVAEFHAAIAETDDDFDTDRIARLVRRWWAQAVVLLDPDPDTDAIHARLAAGDDSDLVECWRPQPDGTQHIYRRDRGGDWIFDARV